jgi:hypothetical protein
MARSSANLLGRLEEARLGEPLATRIHDVSRGVAFIGGHLQEPLEEVVSVDLAYESTVAHHYTVKRVSNSTQVNLSSYKSS